MSYEDASKTQGDERYGRSLPLVRRRARLEMAYLPAHFVAFIGIAALLGFRGGDATAVIQGWLLPIVALGVASASWYGLFRLKYGFSKHLRHGKMELKSTAGAASDAGTAHAGGREMREREVFRTLAAYPSVDSRTSAASFAGQLMCIGLLSVLVWQRLLESDFPWIDWVMCLALTMVAGSGVWWLLMGLVRPERIVVVRDEVRVERRLLWSRAYQPVLMLDRRGEALVVAEGDSWLARKSEPEVGFSTAWVFRRRDLLRHLVK